MLGYPSYLESGQLVVLPIVLCFCYIILLNFGISMSSLVTSIFHISRSFIKRSLSDGNILCDNTGGPVSDCNVGKNNTSSELLPMQPLEDIREPSDSAPEISIEPNPCSRCSIYPCLKTNWWLLENFRLSIL